jgi:hypothetical protein
VYRVIAPCQGALWTVIKAAEPLSEQQPCLKNRRNLPANRRTNHADSGRFDPYLEITSGLPVIRSQSRIDPSESSVNTGRLLRSSVENPQQPFPNEPV